MAPYELLDDRTRRYMLAAFDDALQTGSVSAPALMNDAGRARYPQLVRSALAEGDEETLFQSLADASLWTLWTYGYNLTSGFGMQPSDWAGEARRTSSGTFRYWYEVGLERRREQEGLPG
jgi:hypothetical protein